LDVSTAGVAVSDVNNDGRADLVVSGISINANSGWLGRILVLLQDRGTGQLLPAQEYVVSANGVSGVAIADLNNDGKNDVVTMSDNLSIFYQNANGVLGAEVIYNQVNTFYNGEIHIADMNNNGLNDIVVQSGPLELAIIYQVTPGNFSLTPEYYVVQTSYWPSFNTFDVGDVNGDGLNDIVATGPGNSNYLNIFLQNTLGTLDPPNLIPLSLDPYGLEIADITGDGLNDILFDVSGGIAVYPQQPDNGFQDSRFYRYQSMSYGGSLVNKALSVADVTGDGQLNAILTWSNEGLYVFPYNLQYIVR
jgi:hypothetical protein